MGRTIPEIARSVVVLPGAVGAEQRDDLARGGAQRQVAQHRRAFVPGVQVLDLQDPTGHELAVPAS